MQFQRVLHTGNDNNINTYNYIGGNLQPADEIVEETPTRDRILSERPRAECPGSTLRDYRNHGNCTGVYDTRNATTT